MPSKSLRLAVLASGRGSDLQSILDATREGRIQSRVAVVLSDKPEAMALERARSNAIPADAYPPDPNLPFPERKRRQEAHVLNVLQEYRVDLVVLAGYMRLLSREFVEKYPNRIVNIHPALLPCFPGLHAQQQALEWGTRIAGITTHYVDHETDHGPILLQAAVALRRGETDESLSRRLLAIEHQLLPRTIHLIEQGRAKIVGRRVILDPDASWADKYPRLDGVLYGEGY